MSLLVTGGSGYIGSHFCVLALQQQLDVVIIDNLSTSSVAALGAIHSLAHRSFQFEQLDIRNEQGVMNVLRKYPDIDTVVHFAAKKDVLNSIHQPLRYYSNNLVGSVSLLTAMHHAGIKKIVFSSTAAVYADAGNGRYNEEMPVDPLSPYGKTKRMVESLLSDCSDASSDFSAVSLRYFNVAGAHPSGLIGEDVTEATRHLFPQIMKVTQGLSPMLSIYGNNYDTPDGTGIRDYIHVMDIAQGHLDAIRYLNTHHGHNVFNLGRGEGCTILELLHSIEKETGHKVPFEYVERRKGDLASVIAEPTKANQQLGWHATKTIADMVRDSWRYLEKNTPNHESRRMGM